MARAGSTSPPPSSAISSWLVVINEHPDLPGSLDGTEAAVGVVGGDRAGELRRVRAEVGLVDDALVVDDEGHDAAVAVLGGVGDQREACGHLAVGDVAFGAAGGGGRAGGGGAGVAFGCRLSGQVAKRAALLAGFGGPEQAVVLVGRAAHLLCVDARGVAVAGLGGVLLLGNHVRVADADGGQLVA